MKRFLILFLTLSFLPLLEAPVYADILWEPTNDSFYEAHRGDCINDQRSYYANGKEGFITVWDRPGGSKVIAQYENGQVLYIPFIYQKNNWGMEVRWKDQEEIVGWTPMSDLSLIYDHISFQEEYAGQIQPYNGEFAQYDGQESYVNFFEYPGAAEISFPIAPQTNEYLQTLFDELTGRKNGSSVISSIFMDEQGLTWGYVGYLFGHVDAWFCLDDPDGENFPVRQVNQPNLIPAQPPVMPAVSAQGYLPYYLVGGVVAVTFILLLVFYRKKGSGQA